MSMNAAKDKLIVALDVASYDDARALVNRLGDSVTFYKIGLELLFSDGLALARELKHEGKRVFLDLKFLDIGNTVERAVASAAGLGIDFLTVHGHDTKTLQAAVRGRTGSNTKLLAVTVLTSLDQSDLDEQGISATPGALVLGRARLAQNAGFDGVIASGQEAAAVRAETGADFLIVTPGIRLPGGDGGDQSRITSPEDALRFGANHLVVGRPITAAKDPKAAAETFLSHIAQA
jgi:orotidine-5'-phosphate decarboxylase